MRCVDAGINSLFTKIGCERSAIDDMLGVQDNVTDQNLLQYLGIVESRSNQLLLAHAYNLNHKVSRLQRTFEPLVFPIFLLWRSRFVSRIC